MSHIQRFCLKFFAKPGYDRVDDARFIDIFHEWIRLKKLPGILLDVADYRHVPDGPGVMLITHDINFAMDYSDGRFGLLAQRKQGRAADLPAGLLELVRATVMFAGLLEAEARLGGNLRFEAGQFHFLSNDRLYLPNIKATYTLLQPVLRSVAAGLYSDREVSVTWLENDPRERLTVLVDAGSVAMSQLLERVGATA